MKYPKALKTEKKFEFFLGMFFLIPPILGVFSFLLSLCDARGDFANMSNLSIPWVWRGDSMSPVPLYLGLMAIAGVLLIKDSLRYVLDKEDKTGTEVSNTSQESQTEKTE